MIRVSAVICAARRTFRRLSSAARVAMARVSYRGVAFARNVQVGSGVVIRATDGGLVRVGRNVVLGRHSSIIAKAGEVVIGDDVFIGEGVTLVARSRVEIGPDCLIAERVTIRDQNHRTDRIDVPFRSQGFTVSPVRLHRNVWIGANACVLSGVSIGESAVVGAGAVVTRSVPSGALAVGVPAVARMKADTVGD